MPYLDTVSRVGRAEMTSIAIGFANDGTSAMFTLALVLSFAAGDDEIGTATIGDPDSVAAFVSPRLSFDAGRPAYLTGERGPSKAFKRADAAVAVVGLTTKDVLRERGRSQKCDQNDDET